MTNLCVNLDFHIILGDLLIFDMNMSFSLNVSHFLSCKDIMKYFIQQGFIQGIKLLLRVRIHKLI